MFILRGSTPFSTRPVAPWSGHRFAIVSLILATIVIGACSPAPVPSPLDQVREPRKLGAKRP